MTKEITKAIILQELQDKFKLRELVPEVFSFGETVVPVYNVEPHVQNWIVDKNVVTITSATGFLFYTVPENEQWHLRSYTVLFYSGVYTVAGVYITRRFNPANFHYLDLKAAQSTSYLVNLPILVTLQPGDSLNINIDGYTSTGTLQLYLDVMKEEIR